MLSKYPQTDIIDVFVVDKISFVTQLSLVIFSVKNQWNLFSVKNFRLGDYQFLLTFCLNF